MYQIAIYIRLSKEDGRCMEESNSIKMQRAMLHRYVEDNFTDYMLREFCDDGYTGTNFERPGMQNMLDVIRNGGINCIVVKDFSRFARDYIELGSYLDQIFPFMGVRFISVNDNYDSENYNGSISDIDMNFKNLIYDLYSKDLSKKVRSAINVRKEQGQYVSANSPFGYEKDPEDRHALLIEEDEAAVVRQIFELASEGATPSGIARMLNKNGVKTPVEFKIEKGKTHRVPKGVRFMWSSSAICSILRNEVYIGNIVQKKYTKDFAVGKNRLNPPEQRLVGYNHHEPIIDKELFDKVRAAHGAKRCGRRNPSNPLVGKLVCGCCKKNLRYRTGPKPYFTCNYRYSNTMENCVKKVDAIFLEKYIISIIGGKLQEDGELEKLHMERLGRIYMEINRLEGNINLLSAKIQRLRQRSFDSYREYACGMAGSFCSGGPEVKSAENELECLNNKLRNMEETYNEMQHNGFGKEAGIEELAKEMIGRYIDKIEVWDEQHIEIRWK